MSVERQTKGGDSPGLRTFRKFIKNKTAIFGLSFISITIFIALFAYVLAPDNSPNANDQIPEIALQHPGFSVTLLKVRKNRILKNTPIPMGVLTGFPNPYQLIPIEGYRFEGDSVKVNLFKKEDQAAEQMSYHLLDVVYPVVYDQQSEQLKHLDKHEQLPTAKGELLIQQITESHIVERTYFLGTDKFGRSVWSRLLIGVRVSLIVGFIAVLISLTIGVTIGALGGYYGGRLDQYVMLLINTVWSIPTLLLVFAIVLALGRSVVNIFIAVGLTMWVDIARIVRGQVMDTKKNSFVEAAQSMGFDSFRIIFKHLLPNIIGSILVISAANFATAILIEAGLSYLGFGIQPPTPSWGNMLNENYGYAISGKPFLAFYPALAIMLLVLSFNLVGNGLRDAFDNKG